jgi:hypothetical protein
MDCFMSLLNSEEREWRAARRAFAVAGLELRRLRLALALKRFNPSQPRVPAGNPDGGQWTDGGGGGSPRATLVSGRPRRSGSGTRTVNGRIYETTPAQEVRLDVSAARARALMREVQRHDPNWRPTPSIYEGVEGEILANESNALQAAARLRELQQSEPVHGPMEEILLPNGQHVGMQHRRASGGVRTVTPSEFGNLLETLAPGAQVVASPPGYRGLWYQRPDGSIFGVRRSEENRVTMEVIQHNHPIIRNGYKVHQE